MNASVSRAADRVRWARAAAFFPQPVTTALRAAGGFAALAAASPATLRALGLSDRFLKALGEAARFEATDLRWLEASGHYLLPQDDPRFPPLLAALPDAPFALWVRGNPALLRQAQLAIVGSRRATPVGREVAAEFAGAAVAAGWVVTSGLAEGVDAAAHRGALAATGPTVAVCGTGPDLVYPPRHQELAAAIAVTGAIVTEFPPGIPARPAHFPYRNRLLAGLAIGTVVIEAALRSGSLVTARLAAEQGREVYAVPGSIRNPAAQGCNALLKDGARLADNAPELLNELAFSPLFDAGLAARPVPPPTREATAEACREATPRLDRDEEILLDALGFEQQDFDTLVARTGFRPAALARHLLQLELAGLLELRAGGQYARLGTPGRAAPPAPSPRPTTPPH
jgi:DNA processing protein